MKLKATCDYQVIDRNALALAVGDQVKVGRPDAGWEGWVWVSVEDGRGTYVPRDILEDADASPGALTAVLSEFQAKDLSVTKGEEVETLKEVQGWLWCRNAKQDEGWLPAYLLRE